MSSMCRKVSRASYRLKYGAQFGNAWRQHRKEEEAAAKTKRLQEMHKATLSAREAVNKAAQMAVDVMTAKVVKRRNRLLSQVSEEA